MRMVSTIAAAAMRCAGATPGRPRADDGSAARRPHRVAAACARGVPTVVMSLFVNPSQFGADEDLAAYPRRARDAELARDAGGIFCSHLRSRMYPDGFATTVVVGGVQRAAPRAARAPELPLSPRFVAKLLNIVAAGRLLRTEGCQQVARDQTLVRSGHPRRPGVPPSENATARTRVATSTSASQRRRALASRGSATARRADRRRRARQRECGSGGPQELERHAIEPSISARHSRTAGPGSDALEPRADRGRARVGRARLIDNLLAPGGR